MFLHQGVFASLFALVSLLAPSLGEAFSEETKGVWKGRLSCDCGTRTMFFEIFSGDDHEQIGAVYFDPYDGQMEFAATWDGASNVLFIETRGPWYDNLMRTRWRDFFLTVESDGDRLIGSIHGQEGCKTLKLYRQQDA